MKPPASSAAAAGDKGGGVDPSLPRFKCQECQRALVVVGVESFTDKLPAHAVSGNPCLLNRLAPFSLCWLVVIPSTRIGIDR